MDWATHGLFLTKVQVTVDDDHDINKDRPFSKIVSRFTDSAFSATQTGPSDSLPRRIRPVSGR